MWVQSSLVLSFGVLLTVLEKGLALKCYKCISTIATEVASLLNECGSVSPTTMANFRNVCLKKIFVDPSTKARVIKRECKMPLKEHKIGTCPDGENASPSEFCSTCDHDGCNSATKMDLVLVGVVPAFLMTLFS